MIVHVDFDSVLFKRVCVLGRGGGVGCCGFWVWLCDQHRLKVDMCLESQFGGEWDGDLGGVVHFRGGIESSRSQHLQPDMECLRTIIVLICFNACRYDCRQCCCLDRVSARYCKSTQACCMRYAPFPEKGPSLRMTAAQPGAQSNPGIFPTPA